MDKKMLQERLLWATCLVVLLVFGGLLARHFMLPERPPAAPVAEQQEPPVLREVILYFAVADGTHLESESRQIEDCLVEEECLLATVAALVQGPTQGLAPVVPPGARVNAVSVEGNTAIVDFSREFVSGHPGGAMSELLSVLGVANSLAVNFPHIRQVRIEIEGKAIDTIKGHVDLRNPVPADFNFGIMPEGGGDAPEFYYDNEIPPAEQLRGEG